MTQPADHDERLRALDTTKSVMLVAPAGSGKTSTLAARYLALLAVCERPENVLATTFTNKAAGELRDRIIELLRRGQSDARPTKEHEAQMWDLARAVLARDAAGGWNLVENPSRLRAMTIDKFNALQAGKLPVMSGIGGGATVDENSEALYREAVLATLAELESETLDDRYREALRQILEFGSNRADTLVPLLSDMLAKRDQWLLDAGSAAVDLTAADGLLETISSDVAAEALAVLEQAGGVGRLLAIIREASGHDEKLAWAADLPAEAPEEAPAVLDVLRRVAGVLLTATGSLRQRVTAKEGFPAKKPATEAMNAWLKSASDISGLTEALVSVRACPDATYPAGAAVLRENLMQVLRRLVANLNVVFSQRGRVDFSEVALRALASLGRAGQEPVAISDAALEADEIRHILVDEAQDTSISQFELLGRLVAGWEEGDGRTITFAGDPMQSIYFWRGASVSSFVELLQSRRFAHLDLEIVQLRCNFRSEAGIVTWFNQAFRQIFPTEADALVGQVGYSESVAEVHRPEEPGMVVVHPFVGSQPVAEAGKVVSLVQEAIEADPDGERSIAILVRNRSHLADIIPALKAAGISYAGQDIDPLMARPAISNLASLARALWHVGDRTSWVTVLRSPWLGFSWADCALVCSPPHNRSVLEALADPSVREGLSDHASRTARHFLDVMAAADADPFLRGSFADKVKATWLALGGPASISLSDSDDVETFFAVLRSQCVGGRLADIEQFELSLGKLFASPGHGRVTLMTMHKAKGLEFDTVIIPGLGRQPRSDTSPLMYSKRFEEGFFIAPNPGKDAPKDSAESRLFAYMGSIHRRTAEQERLRLVYVGITRAARRLHLVGCADPSDDGPKAQRGSLLDTLWPAVSSAFDGVDVVSEDVTVAPVEIPAARRLADPFVLPTITNIFDPIPSAGFMPAESTIRGSHEEDLRSMAERAAGTVYHQVVRRIVLDGLDAWPRGRIETTKGGFAAQLRMLGCPEADVTRMVQRVVDLLLRTVDSDVGRWVLRKRDGAEAELCLSGQYRGEIVTRYLDLVFHEDGIAWLIDHKSAGMLVSPDETEAFVRGEVGRYAEKMAEYRELLLAAGELLPIKTALYFPALNRLEVVG